MNNTTPPIADESTAERVIESFLAGYDPLLYAADLGLTPEQVFDQVRWTLSLYIEKAQRLSRKGKAGRKPLGDRAATGTERARKSRAAKK